MKRLLWFSVLVLTAGCASAGHDRPFSLSHSPVPEEGLMLDNLETREASLRRFLDEHASFTEMDKINYLLTRVRESRTTFVRNGDQFDGETASRWLRWKMMHRQYKNNPILTGRDFVDRVCLQSNRSGIPYEVILAGGQRERLRVVLDAELKALDEAIRDKSFLEAVVESKENLPRKDSVPVPVLIPAAA